MTDLFLFLLGGILLTGGVVFWMCMYLIGPED